jgi:hypothetical protein
LHALSSVLVNERTFRYVIYYYSLVNALYALRFNIRDNVSV